MGKSDAPKDVAIVKEFALADTEHSCNIVIIILYVVLILNNCIIDIHSVSLCMHR